MNNTDAPARQASTAGSGSRSTPTPIATSASTTTDTASPRKTENGLSFSAGNTIPMQTLSTAPPRHPSSGIGLCATAAGSATDKAISPATTNGVSSTAWARTSRP